MRRDDEDKPRFRRLLIMGGGRPAVAAPGLGLQTNIVSFWALEDTNWTDAVGGNTLTGNGSPTVVAAKVGNGLNLVAASSQFLSLADNASLSTGPVDFSISAWVNPASILGGAGIVQKFDNSGQLEYALQIVFSGSMKASFSVSNAGGSGTNLLATTFGTLSVSTWYHIVATFATASRDMNIYVNGGSNDSATAAGNPVDGTDTFWIGNGDGTFFNGIIDQVGFWKGRVLSAADVTALYNGGNGLSYAAMA